MIREDYVSFEVAKLLEEKGFREPVTELNKLLFKEGEKPVLKITHQMAMKWLREVYDIKIMIRPYVDGTYSYEILNGFWYVNFDSYEEAAEAAIKYCLKNLI